MIFSFGMGIPAFTVFLQGIISFFSPCILPLLPVYLGYLSGGGAAVDGDGALRYRQIRVIVGTLFFVIGISFAFFLLGLGMTAVGSFFGSHRIILARIGGAVAILFGLYQLGVFGDSRLLSTERRLPFIFENRAMTPFTALVFGFVFSFSWTPCVGPALSSVLLMAASAQSRAAGFMLIGVYTLGFVIPFILSGIFTTRLLMLFKKHKNVVRYSMKVGGALMLIMGIMMISGAMNDMTASLSRYGAAEETETIAEEEKTGSEDPDKTPAPDFELTDQYGMIHTLSDYRGKVVFLNFWATWCPPCRAEMPDIESLYEEYAAQGNEDVVILGVAFPDYDREQSERKIKDFLSDNGYTYPVLMDTEARLLWEYGITAYPTTYMIDRDGNLYGYVVGGMSREVMEQIIEETLMESGG
ncbi:MAG: redoxin domain-containing protein [Clostridia bacterium]|nr:redoxin domain-containing protein [Clostridia bacterium]